MKKSATWGFTKIGMHGLTWPTGSYAPDGHASGTKCSRYHICDAPPASVIILFEKCSEISP